jgi:hypothetical protein
MRYRAKEIGAILFAIVDKSHYHYQQKKIAFFGALPTAECFDEIGWVSWLVELSNAKNRLKIGSAVLSLVFWTHSHNEENTFYGTLPNAECFEFFDVIGWVPWLAELSNAKKRFKIGSAVLSLAFWTHTHAHTHAHGKMSQFSPLQELDACSTSFYSFFRFAN